MTVPRAEADEGGVQHRILIVPAELLVDELGDSFLDRSSFSVRTAIDAGEALAIVEVWRPSVVLFSSRLDGTTPEAFCAQVREGARTARLLMVTDRVGEDLGDAADSPCDAHLVSPLRAADLLTTIAELTHVRQRAAPRRSLEVLVHTEGFTGEELPEPALSNSLELTEDGLLLEAGRQLSVGSTGRLLFFLPGTKKRLDVQGTVRLALDEVRLLYRIDFVDLAPQHRASIRKLLGDAEDRGDEA